MEAALGFKLRTVMSRPLLPAHCPLPTRAWHPSLPDYTLWPPHSGTALCSMATPAHAVMSLPPGSDPRGHPVTLREADAVAHPLVEAHPGSALRIRAGQGARDRGDLWARGHCTSYLARGPHGAGAFGPQRRTSRRAGVAVPCGAGSLSSGTHLCVGKRKERTSAGWLLERSADSWKRRL